RLELDDRSLTGIGGGQLLLRRRDDLDRTPRPLREQRRDMLHAHAKLAAEPAADTRDHDANLRWSDGEDLGERVLDLEGKLRVGPHGDRSRAVPLGHRRSRLRVSLMDHRGPEPVLEDAVGLREATLDVARDDAGAIADVTLPV